MEGPPESDAEGGIDGGEWESGDREPEDRSDGEKGKRKRHAVINDNNNGEADVILDEEDANEVANDDDDDSCGSDDDGSTDPRVLASLQLEASKSCAGYMFQYLYAAMYVWDGLANGDGNATETPRYVRGRER